MITIDTQLIFVLVALLAFIALGFALNGSIKKYEANKKTQKKKKGRSRYMPEVKKPGK